ncbi:hypothetical protein D3C79_742010 [compost metagenome]
MRILETILIAQCFRIGLKLSVDMVSPDLPQHLSFVIGAQQALRIIIFRDDSFKIGGIHGDIEAES